MTSIVFCVTNDVSYDQRMLRICDSLARKGFKITLIGRKLKTSIPLPRTPFSILRFRCFFNKGKLFYFEYNFRLFIKLLFFKADIFGAVDLDTIVACFTAARLRGKKKAFDAHEYFQEVPEVVRRPLIKMIWSVVAKIYIPKTDIATTVSASLAEEFQKLYKKDFEVIRNVPRRSMVYFQQGEYLLYQGALNEGRGLEQLIDAMQQIELPLKIAGEGYLKKKLQEQVQKLKLQKRIEFIGNVTPDELPNITAKAWLGFNLLQNKGLNYYYSLANKFFDYMQHGVPSMSMNFPEYQKINNEFKVSFLLDELSSNKIADAVRQLLEDPALYDELKNNCLLAREKYNWENEEQKLLKLYGHFG